MSLDLKELANELDELRERHEGIHEPEMFHWEHQDRYEDLVKLEKELGGDLHIAANHGYTIISENDFADYCKQVAIDSEMISAQSSLFNYINWDDWAKDCESDYSVFDFDGETYYWQG